MSSSRKAQRTPTSTRDTPAIFNNSSSMDHPPFLDSYIQSQSKTAHQKSDPSNHFSKQHHKLQQAQRNAFPSSQEVAAKKPPQHSYLARPFLDKNKNNIINSSPIVQHGSSSPSLVYSSATTTSTNKQSAPASSLTTSSESKPSINISTKNHRHHNLPSKRASLSHSDNTNNNNPNQHFELYYPPHTSYQSVSSTKNSSHPTTGKLTVSCGGGNDVSSLSSSSQSQIQTKSASKSFHEVPSKERHRVGTKSLDQLAFQIRGRTTAEYHPGQNQQLPSQTISNARSPSSERALNVQKYLNQAKSRQSNHDVPPAYSNFIPFHHGNTRQSRSSSITPSLTRQHNHYDKDSRQTTSSVNSGQLEYFSRNREERLFQQQQKDELCSGDDDHQSPNMLLVDTGYGWTARCEGAGVSEHVGYGMMCSGGGSNGVDAEVNRSAIINCSINQRDISMIRPVNTQEMSCFSRDQSMLFNEANPRDLSINMRDNNFSTIQSNSFLIQQPRRHITNNSGGGGYGQEVMETEEEDMFVGKRPGSIAVAIAKDNKRNHHQQQYQQHPQQQPHQQQQQSLFLENISKDMSVNFSKVEDISSLLEHERERNERLEERLQAQDALMNQLKNKHYSKSAAAGGYHFVDQSQGSNSSHNNIELTHQLHQLSDDNALLRARVSQLERQIKVEREGFMNHQREWEREEKKRCASLHRKVESLVQSSSRKPNEGKNVLKEFQGKENQCFTSNKVQCIVASEKENGIVSEVMRKLHVKSQSDILPAISQLKRISSSGGGGNNNAESKDVGKLVTCLTDMVVSFAPDNGFVENKPSVKQIWKWLKNVLTEYMGLKQQAQEERSSCEITETTSRLLKVEKKDLIERITEIVEDNYIYQRILGAAKDYFGIDNEGWADLTEVERKFFLRNVSVTVARDERKVAMRA